VETEDQEFKGNSGKGSKTPSQTQNKKKKAERIPQVVEHLPNMLKALVQPPDHRKKQEATFFTFKLKFICTSFSMNYLFSF
jgi:hypothetical protein